MLVGLGELGSRVLDLLVRLERTSIVVAGRDPDAFRQRANLAVLAAVQLGHEPDVSCVRLDLRDVDATAETLARHRPDIVLHTATLLAPRRLAQLPPVIGDSRARGVGTPTALPAGRGFSPVGSIAGHVAESPLGVWLPLQVVLAHHLMQAVARSGHAARVVNVAYPDAVNPLLAGVGLAPWIGAGNIANNVPGLRRVIAGRLGCAAGDVDLRLVMHHAVSHRIHRLGTAAGAPFHLSVRLAGEDVTARIDPEAVFAELATAWRRPGGATGQLMAAASAVALVEAMLRGTPAVLHAPSPDGLPGGYPVVIDGDRAALCLPPELTAARAVAINEAAQRLDGIERIAGGRVWFTDAAAALLGEAFGHGCGELALADCDAAAGELLDWVHALGRGDRAPGQSSRRAAVQPNVRSTSLPSDT
jgi:hypothetical protein